MKYCINLNKNSKYLQEIDEININYNQEKGTLIKFLQDHAHQRINLLVANNDKFIQYDEINLILAIKSKYPDFNVAIRFSEYHNILKDVLANCIENNIPFYFNEKINDWEKLYEFLDRKVSDVFITGELAFNMFAASQVCRSHGVRIRVVPNLAQSNWSGCPATKKFFIRPEDVDKYEPYVDSMELTGETHMLDTYFEIYSKDKEWFGDLDEIIINLGTSLDSRGVVDYFAELRLNCGKKCLKGKPCNICSTVSDLSKILIDKRAMIKRD